MYARTVFDPLTIIDTKGAWQPYLAQSVTPNADHTAWTITVRPNVVFHDGTPLNGAALLTNFKAQQASLLQGLILNPIVDSVTQSGPLAVTLNLKSPWVSLPLVPGRRSGGAVRVHGRPVDAGGARTAGRPTPWAPGPSSSRNGCPTAISRPRPIPTIGARAFPTSTRSPSSRSSTPKPGPRLSSRAPSTFWSPTRRRSSPSSGATRATPTSTTAHISSASPT